MDIGESLWCTRHCCSSDACSMRGHAPGDRFEISQIALDRLSQRLLEKPRCHGKSLCASPSESPASDLKSPTAEFSVRLGKEDLCNYIRSGSMLEKAVIQAVLSSQLRDFFETIIQQLVHGGVPRQLTIGDLEITVRVNPCQPQSDSTPTSSFKDRDLNDYPR